MQQHTHTPVRRSTLGFLGLLKVLAVALRIAFISTLLFSLPPAQALRDEVDPVGPEFEQPVIDPIYEDLPIAEPIAQLGWENVGTFWTGFDYAWERHVFGVETPHRMGSIASVVTPDYGGLLAPLLYEDGSVLYKNLSSMTFTVGQDGDYAFPETRFAATHSPHIRVQHGALTERFEDDSNSETNPDNPTASTHIQKPVSFPLGDLLLNGTLDHYALVLTGFRVDITRPDGASGAMWPHHFQLAIDDCLVGSVTPNIRFSHQPTAQPIPALHCNVTVDIARSWNAGQTQTFEDKLRFEVTLPYIIVGGNEPDFHPTPVDPIRVNTIHLSTGTVPTMTEMGTIRTVQTVDVAGENTYPTAIVAIRGFGFTLGTDQNGEPFSLLRGRYLRKLTFLVNTAHYDPLVGTLELEAKTGFRTADWPTPPTAPWSTRYCPPFCSSRRRVQVLKALSALCATAASVQWTCFSRADSICPTASKVIFRSRTPIWSRRGFISPLTPSRIKDLCSLR